MLQNHVTSILDNLKLIRYGIHVIDLLDLEEHFYISSYIFLRCLLGVGSPEEIVSNGTVVRFPTKRAREQKTTQPAQLQYTWQDT